MFAFEIKSKCNAARRSTLTTPHGTVQTPVFMPVGTAATVKGVTPDQLHAAQVQMVLANTYHLMLRPGADTVAKLGGVHKMMAWNKPILTDSGGYQVFSLAHMRKIDDDGATFQSHIDGSTQTLTPASAIDIQRKLGADIMMQLDECPPADADRSVIADAVRRSAKWAGICKEAWLAGEQQAGGDFATMKQWLFPIQQGGTDIEFRAQSAARIVELDMPGYAIGGLSVGEGHEAMCRVLAEIDNQLPRNKPRYLMGVGEPRDIIAAVAAGVDMFDCVMPTRNGRNAQAFTWHGRMKLRNARWANDPSPLDAACECYTCRNFSRGTIRHLFQAEEMLGPTLLTIHNLRFFSQFMSAIRDAVADGTFPAKSKQWLEQMYPPNEED